MSDFIKHECGIALLRLLKPISYYREKYGTALYGINKLYLLMKKQRNRGQDGAGVVNIKFDVEPGTRYISRYRSVSQNALEEIFQKINSRFADLEKKTPEKLTDADWLKNNVAFTGELFLGHLRYSTYGKNGIEYCHPFLRQNNWMTRNLVVAGNFNLTNTEELFDQLVELGQHPKEKADTVTVMEKIGHFLDEENQQLFKKYHKEGLSNAEITLKIIEHMDVPKILKDASKKFDGGYAMAGLLGHGDAFVLRDPNGIRPAFYYCDDEIAVVASERPAIQTSFNVPIEKIKEIKPGHALIIKKNGKISEQEVLEPKEKKSCSFERIYFSRGNDADIYKERKSLGFALCPAVLKSVDSDLHNTVFSFIPNTAEVAFIGLMQGISGYLDGWRTTEIRKLFASKDASSRPLAEVMDKVHEIVSFRARQEKIAIKDAKLRTFITSDANRDDMVAHVYDTTYGIIRRDIDNLVVLDDSIVRGTTLKRSIIRIFDRLGPKKIVIVSSAPQIRFPDCYGIDMARMGDLIAFRAVVELLKSKYKESLLEEVLKKAIAENEKPTAEIRNVVKEIYKPFTAHEISEKITGLLIPANTKAEVQIIYQSIEGLHASCPNHTGDWYFTGDYPTPGGNKVANRSFINYMQGKNVRAY
ncbi:MAG: amidophosphoribosyltransferase [Bacteroidetes bacterium]|nr:MAG: amidophosphoribosyltransferase [Bacteroidota bacterium]